MDRASDSGSEGWGFESLLAYHNIRTKKDALNKSPRKSGRFRYIHEIIGCFIRKKLDN